LRVFVQDLGICRLILSEIRPDADLYDEHIRALNRRYTNIALDVLRQGIADGELRADTSPQVVRDLIFGGIEHALWRYLSTGVDVDIDELGEQLADALFRGIAAPVDAAVAERLERAVANLERATGLQT
jgi:hypothetical protein